MGTSLIDASMEFLGTTKPLITIADYKLPMFQRFIDKYGWELTEVVSEVYNKHAKELCYNGTLTKDKELQTLTLTKNIKKNVT